MGMCSVHKNRLINAKYTWRSLVFICIFKFMLKTNCGYFYCSNYTLKISQSEEADSGIYQCTATNMVGQAIGAIRINVTQSGR